MAIQRRTSAAKKRATSTTQRSTAKVRKKVAPKTQAGKKVVAKASKASGPAAKAKKAAAKKPVVPARSTAAVREKMTKSRVISTIAEQTQLSRVQVHAVFEELEVIIERHVKKRAVGEFSLAGLLKIKRVTKPSRKARRNVPNPFRPGEMMNIPAKPAYTVVRATALKRLKDMSP